MSLFAWLTRRLTIDISISSLDTQNHSARDVSPRLSTHKTLLSVQSDFHCSVRRIQDSASAVLFPSQRNALGS